LQLLFESAVEIVLIFQQILENRELVKYTDRLTQNITPTLCFLASLVRTRQFHN